MFFCITFSIRFSCFLNFPNRFSNRANPEIIKKTLVFMCDSELATFRTQPIFPKHFNKNKNEFSHCFSWTFMTFSASIFASIFSSIFDGKCSQMGSKLNAARPSFWLSFRDLFRRSTFWCILVAPWLTFGSILIPVGSLLDSVSSLLPPLLAPFGSLLAHLGSLLVPLG